MSELLNLPADLFNPARMPKRDENGFVSHPDADLIYDLLGVDDEGEATWEYIRGLGYEHTSSKLEYDAPQEISDKYFTSDSPDCSYWEPTPPEGEGWFLSWITDGDDGPIAVYLRNPPNPL